MSIPDATRLSGPPQRRRPAASAREPRAPTPSGAVCRTIRHHVGQAGATFAQVMPADEFRHDWGGIYDQLLAAGATPRPSRLSMTGTFWIGFDRSYSASRTFCRAEAPTVTEVRDGVRLDLHLLHSGAVSGGRGPLALRQQGRGTDAGQYERTAKFSTACRARIS